MKTKLFKFSVIFAITLLIGMWSGGFFERYVFNFGFVKNFSTTEAKALQGKNVKDVCSKMYKHKTGKVIGYEYSNSVFIRVQIKWQKDSNLNWIAYPKGYFSKCIKISE